MSGAIVLSRRCKPLAQWPRPDQAAWTAATAPVSQDLRHHGGGHWSPGTRRTVITGYGRWLTWLDQRAPHVLVELATVRITPDRVAHYVEDLRGMGSLFTVASRVEQLGHAMRAMAPGLNWHWLQQLAHALRTEARQVKAASAPKVVPLVGMSVLVEERPANHCLKLAAWPERDRQAWTTALQPGDLLDDGGVAAAWAPATQDLVANGYGRWLGWLSRQRVLDPARPPAVRVTREQVACYLAMLHESVAPYTVVARLEQLCNAMRAIAPDLDWRWLQRAADRIKKGAQSVRDKRARLQPREQLIELGNTLMQRAETSSDAPPIRRALLFRDGLLIAFLADRPIRMKNLASMQMDRHLVQCGNAWQVRFPAGEMKNRRPHAFALPTELDPPLARYLTCYRPILAARGRKDQADLSGAGLWVSAHGTQMGAAAIRHQITLRTREAFGRPVNPHLFRDSQATGLAIRAPDQIQMISALLEHSNHTTSEEYYNLAGSLEAGRRYSKVIEKLLQRSDVEWDQEEDKDEEETD